MRREELIQTLRAKPFRPFRLYVSDGAAFEIRHPEMLMVMRHSAVVGLPKNGGQQESTEEYPEIDRSSIVDLIHVTRIEQLPESQHRPT